MFIRACLAIALFVVGTSSVVAAECDCRSEVSNASAKTTDSCGKIWKDNHCTLKESTVSDSNSSSWQPALGRVGYSIPIAVEPALFSELGLQIDPFTLRGVINVLVLNLLSGVASPEFTASVLDALNSGEGKTQMFALSEGNQIERFTGSGNVPVAISRGCIYGGDPSLNFYLNIRPDNEPCPVADLAGTPR